MDHELTTMWLSIDPMSDKYPSISPYSYCAWNPVKLVDPDGRDVWEINKKGKVVNHIVTNETDAFYIVDDEGKRVEGKMIDFEYGTVSSDNTKRNQCNIYKNKEGKEEKAMLDWYGLRGDENGKCLFEFLSQNTDVEWGLLQMGEKGANGLNVVGTSHRNSSERSIKFLWDKKFKFGYSIRAFNHSHPSNTAKPSSSDVSLAGDVENNARERNSIVPTFNIYLPGNNQYVPYSSISTPANVTELPAITVKPR